MKSVFKGAINSWSIFEHTEIFFFDTIQSINVRNRPKQLTLAKHIPRYESKCIIQKSEDELALLFNQINHY